MEKRLSKIVLEIFGKYSNNIVVSKALKDVLPNDEDIEEINVIKNNTVFVYSLKNNTNPYVLRMDDDATISISVLSEDEQIENLERIRVENGEVTYSALKQVKDESGTIITGTSSILGIDKYNNVVPNRIHTGIWFYDRKFLENVGNSKNDIMFLSGSLDPIESLTSLNINNYQQYHILPDMYQEALAFRRNRGEQVDNINYCVEIETFNRETHIANFGYSLETDFRDPIRKIYDSTIKKTGLEKATIIYSGLRGVDENYLGVFDVNREPSNKEIDLTNKAQKK